MTSGDELRIYVVELARALEQNLPPPPIPPDLPAGARSEIDLLLAGLGMAANAGDPADMAAGEAGYAERALQTGDAMAKFPANEAQSAQSLEQVLGMAQQIPQSLSGVGQGAGGVFGGFFQQLNQALQQGLQASQQLAGGLGSSAEGLGVPAEALGDAVGAGGALLGAGGAAGGLGSTIPAGNLAPPATPAAATFPSASTVPPPPSMPEPTGARGGMGGYPMMPPGAAGGGSGSGGDTKPDTKRVVAPAVKNGGAVQGRVSAPSRLPEVTKRIDGKPVATRRLLPPNQARDDGTEDDR